MSLSLARALASPRVPAEFPMHLGPGGNIAQAPPGAGHKHVLVVPRPVIFLQEIISPQLRYQVSLRPFKVPNMKFGFGEHVEPIA